MVQEQPAKSLSVAYVIDSLETGGAEMMAVQVANAVSLKPGIKVHLIVQRGIDTLSARISTAVTVFYLHKKSRMDVGAIYRMLKYCQQNKIEIIHAHSTSIFMGWLVKKLMDVKLAWHDHYGLTRGIKGKRFYNFRMFIPATDLIFTASRELAEEHIAEFSSKSNHIFWLPNFPSPALKPVAAIRHDKPLVIMVAANRPQKNWKGLIEAFHIVHQHIQDAHLVIAGDKGSRDLQEDIEATIHTYKLEAKVSMPGVVDDFNQLYTESSLAVLSSHSEALPLALLEYGAVRLPVVCTAVGDCPKVLMDGENGWLVPPNDPIQLANAMIYALEHPVEAQQKADNLHNHVMAAYSADAVTDMLIRHYKTLLG